ncbi:MAG: hypothetical protein ACRD7E_13155, partial [Bryobacteraceae bacterium]
AFAGETPDPKQLALVIRYETSLTRAYYKASKELEHLQSARAKTAARDQKTEEKARKTEEKARMSSFEAQLQAYLFAPPPVLTAEEEEAALAKLASLGKTDHEPSGSVPEKRERGPQPPPVVRNR